MNYFARWAVAARLLHLGEHQRRRPGHFHELKRESAEWAVFEVKAPAIRELHLYDRPEDVVDGFEHSAFIATYAARLYERCMKYGERRKKSNSERACYPYLMGTT